MVEKRSERAGGVKGLWQGFKETIYGMSAHDMSRAALRTRASMEHLFILITMGDLLGIPILPPYYSLRLLPARGPADRDVEAPDAAREGRLGRDVLSLRTSFSRFEREAPWG